MWDMGIWENEHGHGQWAVKVKVKKWSSERGQQAGTGDSDSASATFDFRSAARSSGKVPLLCAGIVVVSSKPLQITQLEFGVCLMGVYCILGT